MSIFDVVLLIAIMTLTSMVGMGSFYQHVIASNHTDRFENSGTDEQTNTDQKSNCEAAGGISGTSSSCTANSDDSVRDSGGIASQTSRSSNTTCVTSHPTVLSALVFGSSEPTIDVRGGLTDTCTGLGISGATITFTGTGQLTSGQSTVTDGSGRYEIVFQAASSPGTYTVQAHFAGQGIFEPSDSPTRTYMCTIQPISPPPHTPPFTQLACL